MLTSPAYAGAYVFGAADRPAGHRGLSASGRAAEPPSGGLARAAAGPLARLHRLEHLRGEPEAIERQPKQAQGGTGGLLLVGSCTAAAAATAWSPATAATGGTCATSARAIRSTMANRCQSLSGGARTTRRSLVLEVLRPSAIEVSLQLAEDVEIERAQRHRQWALRLEQARYEVERAQRQYDAVEPENRLVARTLEQRWETALAAEAELQEEQARFLASRRSSP